MDTTRNTRLLFTFVFLAAFAIFAYWATDIALFAFRPAGPSSTSAEAEVSAIIEVRKGLSPNELTKDLASKGILEDTKQFIWLGRVTRQWRKIKAGEYKVSANMTPLEIFSVITSGISVAHPLTIREGENMYEIASDLQNKGLASKETILGLCRDPEFIKGLGLKGPLPPTLEGYLYPDTYFFNRTLTPANMVQQMVKRFHAQWGEAEERRARELGLTQHQVVTLASIVEKETGAPQERPLISSVFHNRLRKKMRLQSDPTTIYGIWERYTGNILKSDLSTKNLYNTYVIPALPVGPISNPGKEAIAAALHPAESDYLFFVSHNDGTHEFTRTFSDHQQAVRQFQLNRKARVGKSWRDLHQRATGQSE